MKSIVIVVALASSANALMGRGSGCCFHLSVTGDVSGSLGQIGDGQSRVGDNSLPPSQFCINSDGGITDSAGRGCIITNETTQFQCDEGSNGTIGFSVSSSGQLEYHGNPAFIACETGQNGGRNVYTTNSTSITMCKSIQMKADTCAGSGASGQSPATTTVMSTVTVTGSCHCTDTSGQAPAPAPGAPGTPNPAPAPGGSSGGGGGQLSGPGGGSGGGNGGGSNGGSGNQPSGGGGNGGGNGGGRSQPSGGGGGGSPPLIPIIGGGGAPPSVPSGGTHPSGQPGGGHPSGPSATPGSPGSGGGGSGGSSQPSSGSHPSAPGPSSTGRPSHTTIPVAVPSTSSVVVPSSSPGLVPSANTSSISTKPSSTQSSGGACVTTLAKDKSNYQYPHLVVPINSSSQDTSYGTQYFATISSQSSVLFNFDIPDSYSGKSCNLVFLFPQKADLETSDYTFNGDGKIDISELSSTATSSTTYHNAPSVSHDLGDITISPGNSYVVNTFSCPSGKSLGYQIKNAGSTYLHFFEDWNPSPLGLYITAC